MILHPTLAKHKHTVIYLMGANDDVNRNMTAFCHQENACFPKSTKVVIPSPPLRESVSGNMWHDFPSQVMHDNYPDEATDEWYGQAYNQDQIKESVNLVLNIVRQEIRSIGDASKVYLVGFSQGGNIALASYLTLEKELGALGGVFIYTSVFTANIDWSRVDSQFKMKTPVHICHGKNDQIYWWD
jgi:predicted esterase